MNYETRLVCNMVMSFCAGYFFGNILVYFFDTYFRRVNE